MRRLALLMVACLGTACLWACGGTSLPSASPIRAPIESSTAVRTATPTTPPGAPPTPSPAGTPDRVATWRAGLAELLPGLEDRHPDPFHGTDRASFQAAIAELDAAIPSLDDAHVLAGFLRIAALVSATGRDAHTGIYPWGEGTAPLTSLPLRLWVFPDGVRVVDALPPYDGLIGARIDTIDGTPIQAARAALDPLIPRDNEATVDLLLPRFLLARELLMGTDVVSGHEAIELTTTAPDGTTTSTALPTIAREAYNAWAGAYALQLPVDGDVAWLARQEEPLWFEDHGEGIVYAQYNRVDGVERATLDALASRLAGPGVKALIVDVRHNFGGEVSAMEGVRRVVEAAPGGVRRFAITGRNTFSAGSLFVARWTADDRVTIVGEPMGGAPTAFGNARPVELGDTGLVLDVSTLLEVGASADDDRPTIEPDLPAPLTFDAWAAGRDPAIETILAELDR